MSALTGLALNTSYHKGACDIASEFYMPCMDRAIRYDRAVGFFNSTIYALAWSSLKGFVERGGKMRIICSPILSQDDAKALADGYSAKAEAIVAEQLAGVAGAELLPLEPDVGEQQEAGEDADSAKLIRLGLKELAK